MAKRIDIVEILMRYVTPEPNSGCWLWTGVGTPLGYGVMTVSNGGPKQKKVYAHRVSFEFFKGAIPEGMVLDHICNVPSCVNPYHLRAVTTKENIRRRKGVNSCFKAHCSNGHPFTAENLAKTSDGRRRCRICVNASNRKQYRKRIGINL